MRIIGVIYHSLKKEITFPLKLSGFTGYMMFRVANSGEVMLLRESEEFIVAISGSFDVILHDGNEEKKFSLNRSYYGLYVAKT